MSAWGGMSGEGVFPMDTDPHVARLAMRFCCGEEVVVKAGELLRLSQLKHAWLGRGEVARAACCFELAAVACGVLTEAAGDVQRLSGAAPKVYRQSLKDLGHALAGHLSVARGGGGGGGGGGEGGGGGGSASQGQGQGQGQGGQGGAGVGVRELCIRNGSAGLAEPCSRVLALYKRRVLEALPAGQRAQARFAKPVFAAAAFFVTAKTQRIRVDRVGLMRAARAEVGEFVRVVDDFLRVCGDVLDVPTRVPRKRDGHDQTLASEGGAEEDGGRDAGNGEGCGGPNETDMPSPPLPSPAHGSARKSAVHPGPGDGPGDDDDDDDNGDSNGDDGDDDDGNGDGHVTDNDSPEGGDMVGARNAASAAGAGKRRAGSPTLRLGTKRVAAASPAKRPRRTRA